VTIDIEVQEPVHTLWLHAKDLQIKSASVERHNASTPLEITRDENNDELLGLDSSTTLGLGHARLHLRWSGQFGEVVGLFKQLAGGRWYAYSDFEPADARAAFPCYDDPRFKVPWTVSLRVASGDKAFSNAREVSRIEQQDGHALVTFATTRPLPTYLIAVAAGPFDLVKGQAAGVPLRIIAPKGQAKNGGVILRAADTMLRFLEQYLDMPMPFEKLDLIAVPRFSGAMENPGLITVTAAILLVGDNPEESQERRALGVVAHEFVHLWFGDLVTPDYWNELWLSEAFATWLSDKVVAAVQPARADDVLPIADKSTAYPSDYSLSGRRIREPVNNHQDMREAFDAITYRKGGAVLTMLESYLGAKRMQRVVRRYLRDHAGGSVTSKSLRSSLRSAGSAPGVEALLDGFLNTTGIPLVHATLICDSQPRVILRQKRYLPLEVANEATLRDRERRWHVPVCMRYPQGGETRARARQCVLLDSPSATFDLHTKACPAWLLPNDAARGYFHYLMSAAAMASLPPKELSPRETLGLVHNIVAGMHAGDFDVAESLRLLRPFAETPQLEVQRLVSSSLILLSNSVITDRERPAYAKLIRSWYQPLLQRLGPTAKAGEATWVREFRPELLLLLADIGEDSALRQNLRARVDSWLVAPVSMSPLLLDSWLRVAAFDGDQALADAYQNAAMHFHDRSQRVLLSGARFAFRDPKILSWQLAHAPRPPTAWRILARVMGKPRLREIILATLQIEKMDEAALETLSSDLCNQDALDAIERFGDDAADGALYLLAPITGCMEFASAQQPSAATLFAPTAPAGP